MFNEKYIDITVNHNGIAITLILNIYIPPIRDKMYAWLKLGLWTLKTGFITYYLHSADREMKSRKVKSFAHSHIDSR